MDRIPSSEFIRRAEANEMTELDCLPEGLAFEADVVYASPSERELKLDICRRDEPPRGAGGPGALRPAMVFVHGGGWKGGSKAQFSRQAVYLAAKHDVVGVCCEYRFSHEAAFGACLQDVKCAVRYVRSRAAELKIDPERVGIAGGSAGGHLAAMVATTAGAPEYEGDGGYGEHSSHVNLCVPHNGVFDFEALAESRAGGPDAVNALLQCSFAEEPELHRAASPFCRATESAPPMLLMHGADDELIPCSQSGAMYEKLLGLGVHAEVEIFPGVGHGWFNSPPHFAGVLERMRRFVAERYGL